MWFNVVLYGLWAVLPVVLAVMAVRRVSNRERSRFLDRYGLETDPETASAVNRSIRRGRTARLAGAALGLSLSPVLDALGVGLPHQGVFYGLGGYLLGAFVTALAPGLPGAETRQASLAPRLLSDYLPRVALLAPLVAIGISAVAVVTYEFEPHRSFPGYSGSISGLPLAAVAVVVTLIAVRIVVARPQPLSTPGLVAVDDAVRTQAVHTLAGVGISIAFFGAASCLFEMGGYATPEWLHLAGVAVGFCAFAGAVSALTLRGAPWRVPRTMMP